MRATPRPAMAALLLVALLLPLVAVLQYRWVGSLSELERQRMERSLDLAARRFVDDFDDTVMELHERFELDAGRDYAAVAAELSDEWDDWRRDSRDGRLLASIHWITPGAGGLEIQRFEPETGSLVPAEWPAWLAAVRPQIVADLEDLERFRRVRRRLRTAALHPEVPALLVAQDDTRPVAFAALTLDREALIGEMIPRRVQRYFGTGGALDFDVLVVDRRDGSVVYASAAGLAPADFRTVDEGGVLFGMRGREWGGDREGLWAVLIRHRAGSLEAAVGAARRRNLAVSFGALLVLGGSIAMLWLSARRAQSLAAQQMGFVAGVSHELRTPLAGISSLSQNLADGLVRDPRRLQEYGSAIHRESGRLREMVETVLLFSKVRSGAPRYDLRPVRVADAVRDAVASIALVAPDRARAIAVEIEDGVPPVHADAHAFRAVVRNVLMNAIKFSDGAQPVHLAAVERRASGRLWVELRVSDRGCGIDRDDLPHVMEPFYRGRRASGAQIEGSGLGLSIVKEVVEAHGGDVSIESRVGEGTTVTLRMPAAPGGAGGRNASADAAPPGAAAAELEEAS